MKLLRRLLSGLIMIALIMTISGMITAKAVNSLFGDPNSAEGSKSGQAMSNMLKEAIVVTVSIALGDGALGWSLPEDEVQAAVRASLKDQEMAALTTQMSGTYKTLSTGEQVKPGEAVLELGAIRDSVLGGVRDLTHQKVAALPVCTPQQGASMAANPPQGMPECRSADPAFNEAMVNQAFEGVKGVIPDRVDLGEIMAEMTDQMKEQMEGQMGAGGDSPSWVSSLPDMSIILGLPLRIMWFLASWGYLALFGLILALVLLNLDTWHAQFSRIGWAALLGAGIPLIGSMMAINYLPVLLGKVEDSGSSFGSMGQLAFEMLMIPLVAVRTISLVITLIGAAGLVVGIVGRALTASKQTPTRAA